MLNVKVYTRPTFRQVAQKSQVAYRKMLDTKRQGMRNLGQDWVSIARSEAPEGRTGRFRKSIAFRTFVQGQRVELRTYHAEPLGTYIIKGTQPHVIRAHGRALKFLWESGPKSDSTFTAFHFYRSVQHPGTKANPFHERAYRRWRPKAQGTLRAIGNSFVIAFTR